MASIALASRLSHHRHRPAQRRPAVLTYSKRGYDVPELQPGEQAELVKLVRHHEARTYLDMGWHVKPLTGHHAHYSALAVRRIEG